MAITILRPCTVFGPNVNNYVSRMIFRNFTVKIIGSDADIQLVHESDLIEACLLALKKRKSEIYNITGDGTIKTSKIAKLAGTKAIPLPSWKQRKPCLNLQRERKLTWNP